MVFVYYTDDYWENGGVDLKAFRTREEAENFIISRIQAKDTSRERTIEDYTVIIGEQIEIEVVETVSKIKLRDT